jgi:hypothetical protein
VLPHRADHPHDFGFGVSRSGLVHRPLEIGNADRAEDTDDGNHHQQFDKGETGLTTTVPVGSAFSFPLFFSAHSLAPLIEIRLGHLLFWQL